MAGRTIPDICMRTGKLDPAAEGIADQAALSGQIWSDMTVAQQFRVNQLRACMAPGPGFELEPAYQRPADLAQSMAVKNTASPSPDGRYPYRTKIITDR